MRATTSQPRNLLGWPITRSPVDLELGRIAQTCFCRSGGLDPISFPLFQGICLGAGSKNLALSCIVVLFWLQRRTTFRYAARCLGLAAQKGQHQAQALLGQMLFDGDCLPRQAARGLMWLTVALDSATADETWIRDSYTKAIAKASEDDRAMALQMLEHWVQGRKD